MSKYPYSILFVSILGVSCAISSIEKNRSPLFDGEKEVKTDLKLEDFKFNFFKKYTCSPDLPIDDEWLGVRLNTPNILSVKKGRKPIVPICFGYILSTLKVMKTHPKLILYKKDMPKTLIEVSLELPTQPTPYRKIKPPVMEELDEQIYESMVTEGYWSVDALANYNDSLEEGTYMIQLLYGGFKSDLREIRLEYN
ncbi:MAG: hypothetical protein AB8E15_06680 [Bdellovibrionales bacterium]